MKRNETAEQKQLTTFLCLHGYGPSFDIKGLSLKDKTKGKKGCQVYELLVNIQKTALPES